MKKKERFAKKFGDLKFLFTIEHVRSQVMSGSRNELQNIPTWSYRDGDEFRQALALNDQAS